MQGEEAKYECSLCVSIKSCNHTFMLICIKDENYVMTYQLRSERKIEYFSGQPFQVCCHSRYV